MTGIIDAPFPLSKPDYLLATGESSMPRELTSTVGVSTVTQRLLLSYFKARKTETTTQVRVYSGSTAAGATPSLCRIGLYSVAANGDLTLVASTANDTSLFAASNTAYTKSWSSSFAKVAGSWYAVGVLVVSSTTIPTFLGQALAGSVLGVEMLVSPPICASLSSQSDLPSTVSAVSLASYTARAYSVVLP